MGVMVVYSMTLDLVSIISITPPAMRTIIPPTTIATSPTNITADRPN
jgi:hypothetical protein